MRVPLPAAMITTWSAMRMKVLKTWVVVVCLADLLSGCSTVRLAYDSGPTLAWWWIDGYGDFSGEQAPRVKDGIRSLVRLAS
jgi:hypothetical protein